MKPYKMEKLQIELENLDCDLNERKEEIAKIKILYFPIKEEKLKKEAKERLSKG